MRDIRGLTRADQGSTLIEVLIAVVILGVTGLALLDGVRSQVLQSGRVERAATKVVTLEAVAAMVAAAPYRSCVEDPTPYDSLTTGLSLPESVTVGVQEFQGGAAGGWQPCGPGQQITIPGSAQQVTVSVEGDSRVRSILRFAVDNGVGTGTPRLFLRTSSTQATRFVAGYPGSGITATAVASDGTAASVSQLGTWPVGFIVAGSSPATITWSTSVAAGVYTLPVTLRGTGQLSSLSVESSVEIQIWPVLAASSAGSARCSAFLTSTAQAPCEVTLTANPSTGSMGNWHVDKVTFDGGGVSTAYVRQSGGQLQTLIADTARQGSTKQCPTGAQRTLTITVIDDATSSSSRVTQAVTC